MSLEVAVSTGLASAVAYGVGTAGQHAAAYCGEVDAKRLADLLRNPRWVLSSVADIAGIVLQVIALANGPVVLVQPILVLSLPVAVLVGRWFGLAKPRRADLGDCALLVIGLAIFLTLLGRPSHGRVIGSQTAGWTTGAFLMAGLAAILLTRRRPPVPRAVVFGAVAGCWFGVVSVLVDAVARIWESDGLRGFERAHGLAPLAGVVVLATGGYLLVQIGFQLGPLGASYPANLILDPVVAVVLGASLLREHVPTGEFRLPAYLLALALVARSAIRLAQHPEPASAEPVSARVAT